MSKDDKYYDGFYVSNKHFTGKNSLVIYSLENDSEASGEKRYNIDICFPGESVDDIKVVQRGNVISISPSELRSKYHKDFSMEDVVTPRDKVQPTYLDIDISLPKNARIHSASMDRGLLRIRIDKYLDSTCKAVEIDEYLD